MELRKIDSVYYKENKIKNYLREEKLLFVFNFGDSSSIVEKSKKKNNNKITSYKVSIINGKKVFKNSIFKNYVHIVEGYFNFVNILNNSIKSGVFEEQILLTIKLYGKMYLGTIMSKLFFFEHKKTILTANQKLNIEITKKSLLFQKHTYVHRNNVI